jgi:hypothetical protein
MSNQGGFSEEAFEKYQRLLSEQENVEFSEGETYDFTRCMRPNGTYYGTRGKCKKGSETGAKESVAKPTGEAKREAAGRVSTADAKKLKSSLEKQIGAAAKEGNQEKTDNLMKALQAVTEKIREREGEAKKEASVGSKESAYKPPAYNPNPELNAKVARAMARKKGDTVAEKSADKALKEIRKKNRELKAGVAARAKAEKR